MQAAAGVDRGWADGFGGQGTKFGEPIATALAQAGVGAEFGEDGAGFDGGQLVLVTQEDDARAARHCLEQLGCQSQVQHRGLIDDQRIDRQRMAGMVAEFARGRCRAQQSVEGEGLVGQPSLELGRQVRRALTDGIGHARGRLARGGGQGDAASGVLFQEAGQQVYQRRRLARARAAADDGQAAQQRHGHGNLLPVDRLVVRGEQLTQARPDTRHDLRVAAVALREIAGEAAFVIEITVQIEAIISVEDQRHRSARLGCADDARRHERGPQAFRSEFRDEFVEVRADVPGRNRHADE